MVLMKAGVVSFEKMAQDESSYKPCNVSSKIKQVTLIYDCK